MTKRRPPTISESNKIDQGQYTEWRLYCVCVTPLTLYVEVST